MRTQGGLENQISFLIEIITNRQDVKRYSKVHLPREAVQFTPWKMNSHLIPTSLRCLCAQPVQLAHRIPILAASFSTTPKASALGRPSQEKTDGYLLESSQAAALLRKQLPARTGVVATKVGMTALYQPTGERIPCTVLQLDRVQVMGVKRADKHAYWAVQVGTGYRKPENITKPMLGHFYACGVSPKSNIVEFRVKGEEGLLPPSTVLKPDHFVEGQYVDVRANTKGKGFAGVWPHSKGAYSHGRLTVYL